MVYTESTDVKTECHGLFIYDRTRLKVDAKPLADAPEGWFGPPTVFDIVAPISQLESVTWRYTTHQPPDDWINPSVEDSAWRVNAQPSI